MATSWALGHRWWGWPVRAERATHTMSPSRWRLNLRRPEGGDNGGDRMRVVGVDVLDDPEQRASRQTVVVPPLVHDQRIQLHDGPPSTSRKCGSRPGSGERFAPSLLLSSLSSRISRSRARCRVRNPAENPPPGPWATPTQICVFPGATGPSMRIDSERTRVERRTRRARSHHFGLYRLKIVVNAGWVGRRSSHSCAV